jgi:signal transduction histidine kinase
VPDLAVSTSHHRQQQAHAYGDRQDVSGMLAEILFVLLVLAVAALMVVDVVRTPSESHHAQTDRLAYGAERAVPVPSGGPEAVAFSPELAGSVTTVPAPDLGPSRQPESISPPPGSEPRPGTESAYRDGSGSRLAGSNGRWRIIRLAVIPAVTAFVAALCVVRIVSLLNGTSIHSQISSVHDGAVVSVLVTSAVLVIVLAVGLWATIKAARFVLRPWQRLQTGILPAAGASDVVGEPMDVFDQMRGEISRLTANETQLRGKLTAMLVNLSRRSRSLVDRQIRLIENLEHGEQEERRLASLDKMNRIALHLYRNAEDLLILAGQEPSTGLSQPVTLTYLVQAAASEIEEGERVSFDLQPDIAVRGPAAGDVAHLLAELIQNATSFSAADMPVHITGHALPTGGVLVDITDRGIGMTAKEMAYANWQLENPPPATDIDVSKWMGLLVVARLAARHGVRVRLNQTESGGITALVWLPDQVITHQGAATPPVASDLGRVGRAPSLPEAAVDRGYVTAERMTTAARPAEFVSAQANSQDAATGPRLGTDAYHRPGPARPPDRQRPVRQAEEPVVLQAEQPLTPQADQLMTLQAEQPATLTPSGSGQADAIAGDGAVSGLAARALSGDTAPIEVILPPADNPARTSGPLIYDAVESRWFMSGRQAPGLSGRTAVAEDGWSSPADAGWQAAQTVDMPSSADATAAGLPRRLPNANLVPGSIPNPQVTAPSRSAAAARDRFAGLQRGVTEGRSAAREMADPDGTDES